MFYGTITTDYKIPSPIPQTPLYTKTPPKGKEGFVRLCLISWLEEIENEGKMYEEMKREARKINLY